MQATKVWTVVETLTVGRMYVRIGILGGSFLRVTAHLRKIEKENCGVSGQNEKKKKKTFCCFSVQLPKEDVSLISFKVTTIVNLA